MYSNYLLSPNFKGTNVSALGEKMSYFLFILRVFHAMQALFFMGGGAEGCL